MIYIIYIIQVLQQYTVLVIVFTLKFKFHPPPLPREMLQYLPYMRYWSSTEDAGVHKPRGGEGRGQCGATRLIRIASCPDVLHIYLYERMYARVSRHL